MGKIKQRIPEGQAIVNSSTMIAEGYNETMYKKLKKEYIRFAENVIMKVSPVQNSKVLEIGPGPGWAGICLLRKRSDLTLEGIEPSSDMIRVAIENAKREGLANRIKYHQGFGEEMKGLLNSQYDLVISRDSLHHWEDPEKVFKEIQRILKPDGKVYIQDCRRDLGVFAKMIVNIIGILLAGNLTKYWKKSIQASYTSLEVKEILKKIGIGDWMVIDDFLDLAILKL